jgi:hypothetical protein
MGPLAEYAGRTGRQEGRKAERQEGWRRKDKGWMTLRVLEETLLLLFLGNGM